MDALKLVPESARSDHYWVGSLSMSVALALKAEQPEARRILKRVLDDFLRSPLPSSELRSILRQEMKR